MRIPFIGPAYRTRSVNQSAQRLVNWYLERTEKGGKTEYSAYPTPGLVKKATLGAGPTRNAIVYSSFAYVVSGNEVYKLNSGYGATLLGAIGTSSGFVGMATNGLQVLIVDGVSGYVVDVATGAVTAITDPDFPAGVTWCAYLDGYFVVGGDGSQAFYISSLADGAQWNGADFASAEGDPDPLVAGIVDHRELWLFGSSTAEIWFDTGNADFPIERSGNAFVEHGCAAVGSVAKLDNTVFWLGKDTRGDGILWRAEGYTPQRISDHGFEYAVGQYERIDDAVAYTYQQEGHSFYVINFPSADATWVFDVATGFFHERAWLRGTDGSLHRHRSQWHVMFGRDHLVGDWENGNVYVLDLDTYTDDGDSIKRIRTTFSDDAERRRIFYQRLELDIEAGVGVVVGQGSDPRYMMRYSNDGGHTWSNTRYGTLGKIGEYSERCYWEQLGAARSRVWEVSITDPVKAVILGGVILAAAGSS